ncbi:MAG: tRNA 2-thiocytidine(32) synthetase TtcA [Archangiaceae bacterium]|nr:tRNA 2-thiocytidine(32) synthetase TtcA [Archangiaceae bacterium]
MNELDKLEKSIVSAAGKAVADWNLIEDGDRIMVCLSGGKDSYTMLHVLEQLRRRAPVRFELVAVNLDQGHPGYPGHLLEGWLKANGYAYRMLKEDTYSIVLDKLKPGQTQCSLCSRLRRGILYNAAVDLGCNKIALGHHRDDLIHTYLLNLFFAGASATMPPLLHSDDGRNTVIRPLCYANEADIARFAELKAFPIIPCDLCGSQENLQRKKVKRLVEELSKDIPNLKSSIMSAMGNLHVSHLLDKQLWSAPTEEAPPRAQLKTAEGLVPLKFGEAASSTGGDRHGA